MSPVLLAILALTGLLVVILLLVVVGIYNRLVTLQNNCDTAFGNIDVILRQRSDEVPNLVAAVKGYAAHEANLFAHVAQARVAMVNGATIPARAAASEAVSSDVRRLFAVAEAYPQLKANQNFLALQHRISALEDILADRREFYNESVRIHNTQIAVVPSVWVARRGNFPKRPYFTATGEARVAPKMTV